MRCLYVFFVLCCIGCTIQGNQYCNQIDIIEKRLAKGDITCFDELNVWGRKWQKTSCDTKAIDKCGDVIIKFISNGEVDSSDKDDIVVVVHMHFDEGKMLSWGYSYMYEECDRVMCGGIELDEMAK